MKPELASEPSKLLALPTECIAHIVSYLWEDVSSLHSLLVSNRLLFGVILPVLYRDPFRLVAGHSYWTETSKPRRMAHLMKLLKLCSESKQDLPLPEGLQHPTQEKTLSVSSDPVAPPSPPPPPPPPPPAPLSSMSEQLLSPLLRIESKLRPVVPEVFQMTLPSHPLFKNPLSTDYLYYYTSQSLIPRSLPAIQLLYPAVQSQVYRHDLEVKLARIRLDMTRIFVFHCPSRIQVLSVTASQLFLLFMADEEKSPGFFAKMVQELGALRRLELDVGSGSASVAAPPQASMDENGVIPSTPTKRIFKNDLQAPITFIQEHQRVHQSVDDPMCQCPQPSTTLVNGVERTSAHYCLRRPRLLEIMIRGSHRVWGPTHLLANIEPMEVVDLSCWNSDVPQLDEIPTSRLYSFRVNIARRLGGVEVKPKFIQQCTQLQELWAPSTVQHPDEDHAPPLTLGQASNASQPQDSRPRSGLFGWAFTPKGDAHPPKKPPLKRVRLYGGPQDLTPSLENAVELFNNTLEELWGFEDGYARRNQYHRFAFRWQLPNLTVLDIWDLSMFANMKHLEELQLLGASWRIDNDALLGLVYLKETPVSSFPGQEQSTVMPTTAGGSIFPPSFTTSLTPLSHSLQILTISDSHLATRRGLIPFVTTMEKLRTIKLGATYRYLEGSLEEAAGPRLRVEINLANGRPKA
ncbi:hypothetical protein BGW38_005045 [Lunasporangiospora selenospora]|uniref:Uncharacterized protein n=1 Tax=Lunasporangiospora selenospora TaxID=979761 RepID=A0A9P6KIP6_9FUNG|nr:hypothetical protein BGW38_005045 [Lunasporangiospora selenospora]